MTPYSIGCNLQLHGESMTREFVQLSQFIRQWKNLGCNDDDLRELEEFLCLRPDHGNVVIGTGGLRKIRWKFGTGGKRGGMRVLYVDFPEFEKLYLLGVFTKTIRVDHVKKKKRLKFGK